MKKVMFYVLNGKWTAIIFGALALLGVFIASPEASIQNVFSGIGLVGFGGLALWKGFFQKDAKL